MLNEGGPMFELDEEGDEAVAAAFHLEPLRPTNIPVAPCMEKALGYYGVRRYVAFMTECDAVYWMDGIAEGWSVGDIWNRFLNHPLIAPKVDGCRFTSRTVEPEELTIFESPDEALRVELAEMGDVILLDREDRIVWTGLFARALLELTLAAASEEDDDYEDDDDEANVGQYLVL